MPTDPETRSEFAAAMEPLGHYTGLEDLCGIKMPPEAIIASFRKLGWENTFKSICLWSATLSNSRLGCFDPGLQQLYAAGAIELSATDNPLFSGAGDALAALSGDVIIAHERLAYFMQVMAANYCSDAGPGPSGGGSLMLMLACNDVIIQWASGRDDLEDLERGVADCFVASRFDSTQVALTSFVRAWWLQQSPPRSWDEERRSLWPKLQEAAFCGLEFNEYWETFLGPLAMNTHRWGLRNEELTYPMFKPASWLSETRAANGLLDAVLDPMSCDRSGLRASSALSVEGLPINAKALIYRPLVRFGDELWAASPKLLRGQLHGGTWGRMRQAAQSVLAKYGGSEEWLRAFGERFEEWCQFVARAAEKEASFQETLFIPDAKSKTEEVHDVVISGSAGSALFEMKGSLIPVRASKDFADARDILKWYERFFFATATKKHRGGVMRQIDARILKIRDGRHSDEVKPDSRLFPCVVTYENLGENAALYDWIDRRCREEHILQGDNVAPVSIMSADDYEKLLAFGAHGQSITGILETKSHGANRIRRLDRILADIDTTLKHYQIPEVRKLFDSTSKQIRARLFGASSKDRCDQQEQGVPEPVVQGSQDGKKDSD